MGLTRLPKELLYELCSHLSSDDIKNLRLVCNLLSGTPLRLTRVFVSANPKDIEVFRCIADHETFRRGVKEIIWDEARFGDYRFEWEQDEQRVGMPPYLYLNACEDNLQELQHRRPFFDADLPFHVAKAEEVKARMTTKESWRRYREYADQQSEILTNNIDIKAFEYGLERFPALKRITITPAAHGLTFTPLYRTPMIRTLPYGFNYKLPRGWPMSDGYLPAESWDSEADKERWRGFREVIRNLAEGKGPLVTELVLDVHQLPTGVTSHFFDHPCQEYDNLIAVIRRPGFRRLDLALTVGGQEWDDWESFRNGRMRLALAESSADLEHIHLRTDVAHDPEGNATEPDSGGLPKHFIPLRDIFPIERWPKLQHFGLSKFLVRQDDIISLLLALPVTIRTIELSFLYFLDHGGNYRALLEEMRDTCALDWRNRDVAVRPRVKIGLGDLCGREVVGRAIWLEEEVDSFLYERGSNPFDMEDMPNDVWPGSSGTLRDEFQPEIERPWGNHATLVHMGIQRPYTPEEIDVQEAMIPQQ